MAKQIAVLALCALACAASGAVLKQKHPLTGLVAKQYGHLQDEIAEWERRGLPTEVAFEHVGNTSVQASLTALPSQSQAETFMSSSKKKKIYFYVFNRDNTEGTKVTKDVKDFLAAGWSPDRPTKVVIHGFGNTIKSDIFTITIPDLLKHGDYNVIGVDWGKLCPAPFYIEARNRVEAVGEVVAELIDYLVSNDLLDLADLHLIGHSLGAHVAGNAGKKVTTGYIDRITGLDPAMPLFLLLKSDRLHERDARLVDVVHTCVNLLGIEEPLGDVDFYPNKGKHSQPGCGLDIEGSCSHGRSYRFFGESAVEKNAFKATYCKSKKDALKGKCSGDGATATMGLDIQYSQKGIYYLKTADSAPYDLGVRGQL